jgi:hypothetical protein
LRFYFPLFLWNLILQLTTPWPWEKGQSCQGGHIKDIIWTTLSTNVMALWWVACGNDQLAGGLTSSSIWHLQLCSFLDQTHRSIHESIYWGEFGSILPLESVLGCVELSRLRLYYLVQLQVYLRVFWGVCFKASLEINLKRKYKQISPRS